MCRTYNLQRSYLPPQIEPHGYLYIFGKPRKSSFQNILRITIPSFLQEVMAISVTVRDAENAETLSGLNGYFKRRPGRRYKPPIQTAESLQKVIFWVNFRDSFVHSPQPSALTSQHYINPLFSSLPAEHTPHTLPLHLLLHFLH